jgi:secondary thiamine-phosphate synthase enzyme
MILAWAESRSRGKSGVREDVVVMLKGIALSSYRQQPDCLTVWEREGAACILSVQFGKMSAHEPTTMKSYREELWFETKTRRAYLNITEQIEAVVKKSGVQEGLVLVNAMHITASVYINDDEPGLLKDYDRFLDTLVPQNATYRHNETGEDNGDAHIKRQLMGREVVVAITEGRLDFGPWEQIFYGEFDGKRRKRVLVKVIGS